jgi:hypothetical protein
MFRHLVDEAHPWLGNDQPLGYLVLYGAYKAHPILAVQMFGNKAANKLPTSPVVLPRGKVCCI